MDAVEFIKQYNRICEKYEDCIDCPFTQENVKVPCDLIAKNAEEIVNIVEQWAQAHPQKTMMDDFFKKHPNAPRTEDGTPRNICPGNCGYTNEPESYSICEKFNDDCVTCWSRPMEE